MATERRQAKTATTLAHCTRLSDWLSDFDLQRLAVEMSIEIINKYTSSAIVDRFITALVVVR